MPSSTGPAWAVRSVLALTTLVHSNQLESTQATLLDVARGRWRSLAVHAAAALLAAVVGVLFAATGAAATDELDGRLGTAIRPGKDAVEPAVHPVTSVVQPALEPIAGQLEPLVESLPPITPFMPIVPIVPISDVIGLARDPIPEALESSSRAAPGRVTGLLPAGLAPTLPTPADAPGPGQDAVVASDGAVAAVDGGVTSTTEPGDPIRAPGPADSGPAGSTMPGLVFGLSMAITAGWATAAIAAVPRPSGLTLAPPVPPG